MSTIIEKHGFFEVQSKFAFLDKLDKASDMLPSLQLDIHQSSLSPSQHFYGLDYVIVLPREVRGAVTAVVKII